MKITNLRQFEGPISARGFQAVARFHIATTDGLLVRDWQLVKAPDGSFLTYPPAGVKRESVVQISNELRESIIMMATREMEFANDHQRHA